MRIDKLQIKNFRGFKEIEFAFHRQFNLLVGENASGKTSILDAVSVAAGGWLLGIGGYDTRHIQESDIRRVLIQSGETFTLEGQYPVEVCAKGVLNGLFPDTQSKSIQWLRDIEKVGGRTRSKRAGNIKRLASEIESRVQRGEDVQLPLIAYYGAGRLWTSATGIEGWKGYKDAQPSSRLEGYKTSIDPRISFRMLFQWLANEKYVAMDRGSERHFFRVVKSAMNSCLDGCESLDYEISQKALVIKMTGGERLPYNLLSDGQRAILALVADIAIKAAMLNPQLEDRVLEETCGVVLIDELDLHLHPSWQRHVVKDLKKTFPALQFFASTHSPQVISETPHDEIILLKKDSTWSRPDASIGLHSNDVLREIMGADTMNPIAAKVFEEIALLIDSAEFDEAQQKIGTFRQWLGNLPELEACEIYMTKVDSMAKEETERS